MRRRGKVIHGRFGDRRGRVSGLPPELVTLLDVERKKRLWRRYLPLWGGAVAVGLVVGIGPSLWNQPTTTIPQSATAAPHTATIAPQTVVQEQSSADDQEWAARADESANAPPAPSGNFGFCHIGAGTNCVVDGDTLWIQSQKVRVADIDAPETHDYRCAEEKALGDRATQRLIQLVNSGTVTLQPIDRDEDVYGRKLRIVSVNGTSVGDTLVSEGLARYYEGGRRPWC
jgi:endonuclease YncB( thermonuclease family)